MYTEVLYKMGPDPMGRDGMKVLEENRDDE